jgi:hypothetical protein
MGNGRLREAWNGLEGFLFFLLEITMHSDHTSDEIEISASEFSTFTSLLAISHGNIAVRLKFVKRHSKENLP